MATNDLFPPRMPRPLAAKYLGVSVPFLARDAADHRHKVPFIKIGSRVVYDREQLDAWLRARTVNVPATEAA